MLGTVSDIWAIVMHETKSLPSWSDILFGVLFHGNESDLIVYLPVNTASQPDFHDCGEGTRYISDSLGLERKEGRGGTENPPSLFWVYLQGTFPSFP